MLERLWRKGNSCVLLVKMQIGVTTMENSMEFPQKIQNGTTLYPSVAAFGNISKETQNTDSKGYVHPCIHCWII